VCFFFFLFRVVLKPTLCRTGKAHYGCQHARTITSCAAAACIEPATVVVNGVSSLEYRILAPQDVADFPNGKVVHNHATDTSLGLKFVVRDHILQKMSTTIGSTPSSLLNEVGSCSGFFIVPRFI
jgi:hypothetical protein